MTGEADADLDARQELPPPGLPPADQPRRDPQLGARSAVARSFDLALHTSSRLRPASIYIGAQVMGLLGPLVILVILAFVRLPEIGELFEGVQPVAPPSEQDAVLIVLIALAAMVAAIGFIALAVDSQLMATTLLAGQSAGRPVSLRESVVRARQTFWTLIWASLIVGVPLALLSFGLTELFAPILGRGTEGTTLAASAVTTLVGLPFVFITTGIVLGEVGSIESIRRSIRLARARWRLAVVVALFGAAIGYIQLFALGAGGDILVRSAMGLGLGFEGGALTTFLTLCLLLLGLLALGSLTFTIAALTTAPQVVAFLALTGYAGGLERARENARAVPAPSAQAPVREVALEAPGPTAGLSAWDLPAATAVPRFRWVTIPMMLAIALSVLASLAGVANVVGRG